VREELVRGAGLAATIAYASLIVWTYARQPATLAQVTGGLAATVGAYARTQFYVAYSYYRQGWHRLYRDDQLFSEGLKTIEAAIGLAPNGRLVVDDPQLFIHNADELRAELEAGLKREASDFNPLRMFESRK
jgi:hypothetical protein